MRETTICRSSRTLAAAAALVLVAGAASAQDSPQVGERSGVHVVVEGETLWQLAQQYLGDPFLWPEIYRLNTLVVEDPHWIFPGEELLLSPGERPPVRDSVAVAGGVVEGRPIVGEPGVQQTPEMMPGQLPGDVQPQEPMQDVAPPEVLPPPVAPPPPASQSAPTVFYRGDSRGRRADRELTAAERYRPVRRFEFYAAGFLTENQELPWGQVGGATGRPTLRNLTASSAALIYNDISVVAPAGATYQIGDSLLVARLAHAVTGWGTVVVPTGIARVGEVDGQTAVATVIEQFGRIIDGQVAMPLEPFADPGDVLPVPVENGLAGSIIVGRDDALVAGQQDVFFVNRGRQEGVALGDVFAVLNAEDEAIAFLQIVNVRERSASGLLTVIRDIGVAPDAPVRLFRKMP